MWWCYTELHDLIETIDIVEYISQFVDLEQRGEEYWGLSPFKDEKTPSFSVRPTPPCFYDYSSGIGGNVFTFTYYYFHCSRHEAVQKLEEYAGCGTTQGNTDTSSGILDAARVARKYKVRPKQKKESKCTILPPDYMSRFEKRKDKLDVWRDEGISDESLNRFQVSYDAFSDRIVYPIRNLDGQIVNVGGRTLDPLWKEKKLRKYTYFYQWGTMDVVYGLYENLEEIKKKKEIILFEGAKSVLLADTWGIRNTGAILTSHLNHNQMLIIANLGVNVVFALDRDVDISKDHNIRSLHLYANIKTISDPDHLLGEKDSPVDKGEEVFRKLYDQRIRCP